VNSSSKPGKRLVSRRTALTAAGVGATVALSGVSYVALAKTPKSGPIVGPLVIRVRDLASGQLEVFTGTSRIEIRDKDLAARLVRAAAQA